MANLLTQEFEHYIAEQTALQGSVVFDEFIFAYIPGLNEHNLAAHLTIPQSEYIVHRQAVSQTGVVNEKSVVYSVTIGTEVGDWDYNFIGLINKSKNLLACAIQTDTTRKIKNKLNRQGNSLTRSILLEFDKAQELTQINVSANTWQIDFTLRLSGIDEKIRLTNRDFYGRAVFFDDGFLVKRKAGNQFTIELGHAYVEGVRADLTQQKNITANYPCSVYLDVVHHATVTGAYATELQFLTEHKNDYQSQDGFNHYVQEIAYIDDRGNVYDRRTLSRFLGITPKDLTAQSESATDHLGHSHKLPKASTTQAGIVGLTDSINMASSAFAASALAAKTAYDKGVSALNEVKEKLSQKGGVVGGDLSVKNLKAKDDTLPYYANNAHIFYAGNGKTKSLAIREHYVEATNDLFFGSGMLMSGLLSAGSDNPAENDNVDGFWADDDTDTFYFQFDRPYKSKRDLRAILRAKDFVTDNGKKLSEAIVLDMLIGFPLAYSKTSVPDGFVALRGQSISRSTYPKLYALYGSRLPDLRGEFIRGWDNGRGVDSGRSILSSQGFAIKNIIGKLNLRPSWADNNLSVSATTSGAFYSKRNSDNDTWYPNISRNTKHQGDVVTFDASRAVPTANETRPRNVAFQYICLAG
ncbi:hypothetical protein HPC38_01565 [Pasteurellaceae bacterium HPA106]|uniref:phage tail-collar fiber domain-containing protein n=1 Tax=Spirabiliibacterium pneumoniae TaxID=221400 RepID=UPI001AACDC4C|nr:phage tail protein [Spirabiliibacterium pneumoniae]MBE2895563.1 hypothetical protein [Spirabiliibacterium pneumoniae]